MCVVKFLQMEAVLDLFFAVIVILCMCEGYLKGLKSWALPDSCLTVFCSYQTCHAVGLTRLARFFRICHHK